MGDGPLTSRADDTLVGPAGMPRSGGLLPSSCKKDSDSEVFLFAAMPPSFFGNANPPLLRELVIAHVRQCLGQAL